MPVREEFDQALGEWKDHCKRNSFYSMPQPYIDCDAYRRIVAMGPEVLPLIREEYSRPQEIGDPGIYWCFALKEIVPEFGLAVGEKDSGSAIEKVGLEFIGLRVDEVQRATIKWLDKNISRYLSN